MAVLKVLSSIADMPAGDPVDTSSYTPITNAAWLAPYVTEGIGLNNLTFPNGGPPIELGSTVSDFWFSTYFYTNDGGWVSSNVVRLEGPTSELVRLYSNTSENLQFEYWNGSAWTLIVTVTTAASTRFRIDIHANIADSGGVLEVFKDGISQGSLTGDTKFTADTGVSQFRLGAVSPNTGTTTPTGFSAVIAADEDTRSMVVSQTALDSNGTHTAWTGDYTAVDEAGIDDLDYISSTAAGDTETYGFGNLDATFNTGYDVLAVSVNARAKKTGAGAGFIKPCVYSGTTLGEGTSSALDIVYEPHSHIFAVDPDTATAWTISGVNAAQVGVKSSAS